MLARSIVVLCCVAAAVVCQEAEVEPLTEEQGIECINEALAFLARVSLPDDVQVWLKETGAGPESITHRRSVDRRLLARNSFPEGCKAALHQAGRFVDEVPCIVDLAPSEHRAYELYFTNPKLLQLTAAMSSCRLETGGAQS